MPFSYDNDTLVASIKRRASMPTAQSLFQDSDFLILADEELQSVIFPMMMSIRGNYFVANSDVTMTTATSYAIPSDAIGLKIKDVYYLNANGDQRQLTKVNLSDVTNQYFRLDTGYGYYIEGNNVILYPNSQDTETLRIKYYKRANKMVPNSSAGKITNIDTGTLVVTMDSTPQTWTTSNTLTAIDANPGFESLVTGITISSIASITSNQLTLGSVTGLTVGNWLALDGDSPVAQITPEAHPILAQAVVVKCLEALGDPGIAVAQAKFKQLSDAFIKAMSPRADGQAKKIINRQGHLAWGKFNRVGWW
jgi:hypothetical protein